MKTNSNLSGVVLLIILLQMSIVTFGQSDGWNISTTDTSDYTGIAIANGRIGMLSSKKPLEIQHIILNNVYEKDPELKISQIVLGMNFGNLEIYIDGEKISNYNISNWRQTLNMKEAALTTSFIFKDKAVVSCTVYALRNVQYTGYIDIKIYAKKAISIKATGKIETPSNFLKPLNTFKVLRDLETTMPILQSVATTQFGTHTVSTSATFIWPGINSSRENQRPELQHYIRSDYENTLSFSQDINAGASFNFAWTGAECTTKDFSDPK
jgi:trehalose/maltose hydrolase-like predicted phosphorylase